MDRLRTGLSIGSGVNAWKNPLHILIGCRLIPCIRRPRRVVLLKHDGNRFGINLLRLCKQAIRLRIVTNGLLVKSPLRKAAGLDRFVVFPLAFRHGPSPVPMKIGKTFRL